jgi:dipeptidyl aminopeptidase/acylaminoacyl peptidase
MDLLTIRQVYGLSISPDGERAAFVVGQADYESNSYQSGIYVVRTHGADIPKCLGSAGMPHWDDINQWIPEEPQWSDDSHSLTYRMRMRADATWQVWWWDASGGPPAQLSHVPGDVVRYRWDSEGKKILLEVKSPIDPVREHERLERGIPYDARILAWHGMPVVLQELAAQDRQTEFWVHEVETGNERAMTDLERIAFTPNLEDLQKAVDAWPESLKSRGRIVSAKFSPDRRRVAFECFAEGTDASRVWSWHLFLMNTVGSAPIELTPDSYRVTEYWWSADGEHLYYVESQGDGRAGRMMVFDTAHGNAREFFRTSDILHDFSVDAGGRWIACTRETSVQPDEIAIIDLERSELKTLVDLNPGFGRITLSRPERIAGVNRYGEEWFGHLVRPLGYEAGKRYPLIITMYRSGDYFLLGASGNENPIQLFAAQGFAVLSLDIGRLRNRRPKDFQDRLMEWTSPTASLEMAVEKLRAMGIIDPSKVGMCGFSHGAEILEYAISHTDLFHAAVESGPGARDPFFYYLSGDAWQKNFAKFGLGGWPEGKSQQNWKELGASLNADRITTPLLMNSPDSEYLANLALYSSLRQLQTPVELFIYAGELHVKTQPKHRYEIYERNLDWFKFWLKGEEDSAPGKAPQYMRWRSLRKEVEQRQNRESPSVPTNNSVQVAL